MKLSATQIQRKASVVLLAFSFVCYPLLLISSAALANEKGDGTPEVSTYLATADEHSVPLKEAQQSFECTEKIYSVVELTHYPEGKHTLTVLWIDPESNVREKTEYPFFVRSDSTRLWSWLQLSRATGAGMLQWINPAAGLEEFIGQWKVDVLIDGKKQASASFEVLC